VHLLCALAVAGLAALGRSNWPAVLFVALQAAAVCVYVFAVLPAWADGDAGLPSRRCEVIGVALHVLVMLAFFGLAAVFLFSSGAGAEWSAARKAGVLVGLLSTAVAIVGISASVDGGYVASNAECIPSSTCESVVQAQEPCPVSACEYRWPGLDLCV
jgi:hypothetical protein